MGADPSIPDLSYGPMRPWDRIPRDDDQHDLSWDGPFGRMYWVNCTCGWHKGTFADTPETSIDSIMKIHEGEIGGR